MVFLMVFLMVFIYETVGFFKSPPRLMVHHGAPWAMGLEVIFRKTGSGCGLPREMIHGDMIQLEMPFTT